MLRLRCCLSPIKISGYAPVPSKLVLFFATL